MSESWVQELPRVPENGPRCEARYLVDVSQRVYSFACGRCDCCRRWAGGDPIRRAGILTPAQVAFIRALAQLGGISTMGPLSDKAMLLDGLERRGSTPTRNRFNRYGFEVFGPLGLVRRRMVGTAVLWELTTAGRIAVQAAGWEPPAPIETLSLLPEEAEAEA